MFFFRGKIANISSKRDEWPYLFPPSRRHSMTESSNPGHITTRQAMPFAKC